MLNKHACDIDRKLWNHPLFNEPVVGMNYGFMAKRGYYNTEYAKAQPARMAQMGVNWATLNANFCQEHFYSTKMFLDFRFSSSESEIMDMAKRMQDNGIRVLLKPCITCLDGAAMASVSFPKDRPISQIDGIPMEYWKKWFTSFKECSQYFAELAEKIGAGALLIGAENRGTEGQTEYWLETIELVRQAYSGPISYEFTPKSVGLSNRADVLDTPAAVRADKNALSWMNKLDFLSLSYYPQARESNQPYYDALNHPGAATTPEATLEEMLQFLSRRQDEIQWLTEHFGNKPIAFTEIGARSSRANTMAPHGFCWESIYDGMEQANYMEALFRTFEKMENWLGLFWWKWDETQQRPHYHSDPSGDQGFTIHGKPAEEVFRAWAKKARAGR